MKAHIILARHIAALTIPALLVACGGGSDDSATTTGTTTTTSDALTISGTAATGAAIDGGTVTAKCAAGTATPGTTTSTGSYSVSVASGTLPCVLQVTTADGATSLYSVASGTGTTSVTANITPLTQLVVASLSGSDPATYFGSFDSSAAAAVTSTALATAQTTVLQVLGAAGIDTSAVTDIISGSLTAGSGVGYDGVLDTLQTTISSANTSLGELTTAVASSAASGSTTTAGTTSTLLATANGECKALKTGIQRVIDFTDQINYKVAVDATALTATIDGKVYTLTKTGTTACDYTLNDTAGTRVLVAASGLAVWRSGSGSTGTIGVSLPEQTLDLAALAGEYNRVSTSTGTEGAFGTATFAASGRNTASTNCTDYGSCTLDPNLANENDGLVVNADGGFNYVDFDGSIGARVFAFRNAAGKMLLVGQSTDGTVAILTGQSALTLPSVGSGSAFWQFTATSAGIGTVTEDSNTVSAVDSATGVVTREFADGHFDTINFNSPYGGMRYRAANACTTSSGATQTCSTVVQVPLQGTGIVLGVSAIASKQFMSVSVLKPS